MSKSRLEKFLYALYSLDSSDLPTPLSRIEELYKCWVTGEEVPTFEPLSRVEKYLMAILGAYDADELPNPLSRVEVLLYKLATGDDNLDGIKSFLSEHEELLAEIIRNGGAGGNINIKYMLYTLSTEFNTLYNTAEKPVKSAILNGQTLVNYFKPLDDVNASGSICGFQDGKIAFQFGDASFIWGSSYTAGNLSLINCLKVAPNTNYFVKLILSKPIDGTVQFGNFKESEYSTSDTITLANNKTNIYQAIMTTGTDTDYIGVNLYHSVGEIVYGELLVIPHQDGMENWDIPYFEGMQSVKMPVLTTTGKNLFDKEKHKLNPNFGAPQTYYGTDYIKVKPLTTYTRNNQTSLAFYTNYGDTTLLLSTSSTTFTTTAETNYIRYNVLKTEIDTHQLEEGSVATPYEPYKSNILTVNEEVTLRKIGDVKDELDLTTGKLTQRIGEAVFDGDEMFKMSTSDNNAFFYHELGGDMLIPSFTKKMISNNLLDYADYATMKNTENSMYTNGKSIYIHLTNDINSVSLLQTYLANNPIKIITCLSNESVKTVDLSVVDQDGNNTKLSTFDDITHVTLSSEGLIPEAELEVATKNEEDLEDSIVYTVHTLSEEYNILYNTAEKPVKSAILKGNTLTNLSQSNGEITLTPNSVNFVIDGSTMIKSNTTYTVSFNCLSLPSTNFIEFRQAFDNTALKMENISVVQGHNKFKVTTVDKEVNRFRFKNDTTSETDFVFNNIMIIEGDYTNIDIPYFEGMHSVETPVLKTTGKNLFDGEFKASSYSSGKAYFPNGTMKSVSFPHTTTNISRGIASIIKVKPNTSYTVTISNKPEKGIILGSCYENVDDMSAVSNAIMSVGSVGNDTITTRSFTTTSNCNYMVIGCYSKYEQNTTNIITFNEAPNIQLEESSATEYEPHKSTTVTCNEEVELRGIGDVKDELNLLTGELTQRIGEVVLDGSESWIKGTTKTNIQIFQLANHNSVVGNIKKNSKILCDKLKVVSGVDEELITLSNTIYIGILKTKASTVDELTAYLSQNPITFQHQVITESIKTVDLSVVNQDGNDTKLSTFDDLTHVTLSSEGVIPEAELEVAEKVPEVAASMLTISHEQEVIDSATNEQSENVDSTMIATTEIYEGLL